MRWYVEISSVGKGSAVEKLCLEAAHWQPALQQARGQRGEGASLSGLSVEFLENGCIAIDPALRFRYVVAQAPDDAKPVDHVAGGATGPKTSTARSSSPRQKSSKKSSKKASGEARGSKRGRGSSRASASERESLGRSQAKPAAKRSRRKGPLAATAAETPKSKDQTDEKAAPVQRSAKSSQQRPAKDAPAAPAVGSRPPKKTAVLGSRGDKRASASKATKPKSSKTLLFDPAGDAKPGEIAPPDPDVPPISEGAMRQAQQAARGGAPAGAPGDQAYRVLSERLVEPTEQSPLTYYERVYSMATALTPNELELFMTDRFGEVREQLRTVPPGMVVNLALFDHIFQQRPLRPPVLTLTWKDWRGDEPELVFFPYSANPTSSAAEAERVGGDVTPAKKTKPKPKAASAVAKPAQEAKEEPRGPATLRPGIDPPQKPRGGKARAVNVPAPKAGRRSSAAKAAPQAAKAAQPKAKAAQPKAKAAQPKAKAAQSTAKPVEPGAASSPVTSSTSSRRSIGKGGSRRSISKSGMGQTMSSEREPRAAGQEPGLGASSTVKVQGEDTRRYSPRGTLASEGKRPAGLGPGAKTAGKKPARATEKKPARTTEKKSARPSSKGKVERRALGKGPRRRQASEPPPSSDPFLTPEDKARRLDSARARASSRPPPESMPGLRLEGEDLLTDMFEAVAELHYLNDALAGANFVLEVSLEKLPSRVGLVSLFDIDKREYVVVRQVGGKTSGLLLRLPERSELAKKAMRSGRAVIANGAELVDKIDGRWKEIGAPPKSLICAPVAIGGRYLGLIELADPFDGAVFKEADGHALTYIGKQYAEFLEERGVLIDPDAVVANADDGTD